MPIGPHIGRSLFALPPTQEALAALGTGGCAESLPMIPRTDILVVRTLEKVSAGMITKLGLQSEGREARRRGQAPAQVREARSETAGSAPSGSHRPSVDA